MSCSLSLRSVSAALGERALFEEVNLNVGHKEKVAIVGANGVGKTTLLEIMGGLRVADGGSVELFHEPMTSLADFKKYRNLIGYLFQNSDDQFICPQVLDDVAFDLLACGVSAQEARLRAQMMLERLGAAHLADKIAYHLSGGEKKLVALAGVLVREPKILLLDEPTSALDFAMQTRLAGILGELDVSQVIISHDKSFMEQIADKIYSLTPQGLIKL